VIAALVVAVAPCLTTPVAFAAEIKVLSGSGVQAGMNEIVPEFERFSGHRVVFDYGTVGGMAARVEHGEVADVLIASAPQIAALEDKGGIVRGSRTDLAKTGIGIFVRHGAAKPDIATVETFKQTMLAAKSIGWNDPAAGAPVSIYMLGAFERLGITEPMKLKTVTFKLRSERFAAVARGEVEIGFNQISEIVTAAGVDLVGPLPSQIQNYTLFSAGIVTASGNKEAGRSFLRFVSSAAALAVMKGRGFEAP